MSTNYVVFIYIDSYECDFVSNKSLVVQKIIRYCIKQMTQVSVVDSYDLERAYSDYMS